MEYAVYCLTFVVFLIFVWQCFYNGGPPGGAAATYEDAVLPPRSHSPGDAPAGRG
jgi:hypothetical protein